MGQACRRVTACVLGALLLLPAATRPAEPAVLEFSAGLFDALQADDRAAEFGLQWRGGGRFWRRRLAPMAGTMATTDGGLLAYLGLSLDVPLGTLFALRASFGPGAYARGSGKDLYSAFQMRSGLEAGWRFGGGVRVGLELYHVSNGGTTAYNPGQSSLVLTVTLPLSRTVRN